VTETVQAKAGRYLAAGRLTVLRVDQDKVLAECRGGGAVYHVGYSDGRWRCDCPARGTCCHLLALMLVVVREKVAQEAAA
jgi:uncharacterized Zn finger protein